MSLFWLVYERDDKREVVIQPAYYLIAARLSTQVRGQKGEFIEGHQLDPKMAKKVPELMIGRAPSVSEATRLLKKIG